MPTLEDRVARLEKRLDDLVKEVSFEGRPYRRDWRRTVGMFRGDPVMKEIIEEAQRIREEGRRLAREQETADEQ